MRALLCNVLTALLAVVQSESDGRDYSVFVADRSLKSVAMFSAPVTKGRDSVLEQLSHRDVPAVLCGAHVIEPDLLLTSVRCSPSKAGDVVLYVFPTTMTQDLSLRVSEARVMVGAVSKVTFYKNYQLADGRRVNNAALVQLNAPFFETQSLFNSDDKLTTKKVTEFLPPLDDLVTATDCATVSSLSIANDETQGTDVWVGSVTTLPMPSTSENKVTSEESDAVTTQKANPTLPLQFQETTTDWSVETTVPVSSLPDTP